MAYEHDAIIRAQYERLAAERAQAAADLEAGRLAENEFDTMGAADRIIEADTKIAALDRITQTYVASQQRAQAQSKYGLSKDEQDIARGMFSGDRTMSNDQREQTYAQQKEKLRYLRQTGQYRDDQGSVRR
jgi:hypothetical protein